MKCSVEGCENPKPKVGRRCNVCRNSIQRYGISGPQRRQMLREQDDKCKICNSDIHFDGTSRQYAACIDHCHSTGKVRGILCGNCNTWVGFVENRKINLDDLKEYLKS